MAKKDAPADPKEVSKVQKLMKSMKSKMKSAKAPGKVTPPAEAKKLDDEQKKTVSSMKTLSGAPDA